MVLAADGTTAPNLVDRSTQRCDLDRNAPLSDVLHERGRAKVAVGSTAHEIPDLRPGVRIVAHLDRAVMTTHDALCWNRLQEIWRTALHQAARERLASNLR